LNSREKTDTKFPAAGGFVYGEASVMTTMMRDMISGMLYVLLFCIIFNKRTDYHQWLPACVLAAFDYEPSIQIFISWVMLRFKTLLEV
jgi:hypothetical protein